MGHNLIPISKILLLCTALIFIVDGQLAVLNPGARLHPSDFTYQGLGVPHGGFKDPCGDVSGRCGPLGLEA